MNNANKIIVLLLGLCACGSSDNTPLVDNAAWTVLAASEDDPFSDAFTGTPECSPASYGPEEEGEDLWFGVETEECNYVTVVQPSLVEIRQGDTIFINLFHFRLTAPTPASTRIGIAIDGTIVWETSIPIPSDSASIMETFDAPADLPAGSAIAFHLDNHGENSYGLVELSVRP